MHIGLKLHDEPGFYPDYADVPAPPPPRTVVTVGSEDFIVQTLRLTGVKWPHSGGGEEWTWHYTAELVRSIPGQTEHDRAVELIRELYTLHPDGGPLHAALDDYNLGDQWLPFTPAYAIPGYGPRPATPDTYDPRTHQLCDEIAGLLNGMTEEQRLSAARAAHSAVEEKP